MRILHIIFSLTTGGAEHLVVDLINQQSDHHNVSLIVINNQIDENVLSKVSSRVKIVLIKRQVGSKGFLKIIKLIKSILLLRPQIIHCHNHNIIPLLFPVKGIKILTLHTVGMPLKHMYLYHKLVAISPVVEQDIIDRSNGELKPVLINNGISIDDIGVKRTISTIVNLVQIGRLDMAIKGQDIALKAIGILIYKYHYKDINITFLGEGESASYLEKLAADLKITANVVFAGLKDREWIYNNLHNYDMLIQPSRFEGFGLTVAEGMAAQLPCLVSNIDGPMFLIENGKYGFSFENNDPEDCARMINQMCQTGASIEGIVKAAYINVVNNYSLSAMNNKYLNLYTDLIN